MPHNVDKLRTNGRICRCSRFVSINSASSPVTSYSMPAPASAVTPSRSPGKGRTSSSLDYAAGEVDGTRATFAAMVEAGEIAEERFVGGLQGDATRLPFADGSVRPGDHQRGARAHPGRHDGDHRVRARPEARRHVRRDRADVVAGEDQLDAQRRVPRAEERGRPRAHLHRDRAQGQAAQRRPGDHRQPPRTRTALAVLVAEVCGRRASRRSSSGEGLPAIPRMGDRQAAARHEDGRPRRVTRCSERATSSTPRSRSQATRCRAMSRLPDLDGVLSADEVVQTAEWIASLQLDTGMIPWFPGGHCDPWNHVETTMALDVAGFHGAAERAYEWLVDIQRDDGSWWNYYLPDGSRRRSQARHQRLRLHRHGRVAPLAVHVGPSLRRSSLADRAARARLGAVDASRRRHRAVGLHGRRPPVGLRTADRVLVASPTRCAAVPTSPRSSTNRDPTGRRPPIACCTADQRAPTGLRAEGSLGDGLVLPRPVRLPHGRTGQGPDGRRLGRVRDGASRHPLRQRRAVGHGVGDRRMRDRPRGDRRPGHGDRPDRVDPAAPARRRRVLHRHRVPLPRSLPVRRGLGVHRCRGHPRRRCHRRCFGGQRRVRAADTAIRREASAHDRPAPAAQLIGQHVGREAADQQGCADSSESGSSTTDTVGLSSPVEVSRSISADASDLVNLPGLTLRQAILGARRAEVVVARLAHQGLDVRDLLVRRRRTLLGETHPDTVSTRRAPVTAERGSMGGVTLPTQTTLADLADAALRPAAPPPRRAGQHTARSPITGTVLGASTEPHRSTMPLPTRRSPFDRGARRRLRCAVS